MYPATSQFVERWFPVQERGRANGIIFAGVGLGSGLTPPLVTAIILHHGWRASFWFSAAACSLAGLVWYIAARDTPEQHAWLPSAERTLILRERRVAPVADSDTTRNGRRAVPWAAMLRSRAILAMVLSYFTYGYVAWIFFAWMYTYMAQVRGLNLKTSALYAALPFLAMTIGCLSGGVICDRITARFGLRAGRCVLPTISFALTATLLLLGSAAHQPRAAALLLACGAGSLYLAQSNFTGAVCADIGGEFTSVVTGIVNMSGQLGGACTASLTPLLAAHFGWEVSFITAASLAALGALAWLWVDPNRRPASRRPQALRRVRN